MAYGKTKEACSVVEDTILSKLKSLETTLTNKFNALTDQINELTAKMNQEPNIKVTTDVHPSIQTQVPLNQSNLSIESIANITVLFISE